MFNNPYVLTVGSAFGFAVWPLLAKHMGLSASMAALVLNLSSAVPAAIAVMMLGSGGTTSIRGLAIAVGAGLANGTAFFAYVALLANKDVAVSGFGPAVIILMLAVITVGGALINQESFSGRNGMGLILVLCGAWFLLEKS